MICTFTKDININLIEDAMNCLLDEFSILDITGSLMLQYVCSYVFNTDNWTDGDEIAKSMNESDKITILNFCKQAILNHIRDRIEEQLRR